MSVCGQHFAEIVVGVAALELADEPSAGGTTALAGLQTEAVRRSRFVAAGRLLGVVLVDPLPGGFPAEDLVGIVVTHAARFTSQTATICTSSWTRNDGTIRWLWWPQPIWPTLIRLLGAVAPNTDRGTIWGTATAEARAAVGLRETATVFPHRRA